MDLGSGKGYLSEHLALKYGLAVVGVDSQSSNTRGAHCRNMKVRINTDIVHRMLKIVFWCKKLGEHTKSIIFCSAATNTFASLLLAELKEMFMCTVEIKLNTNNYDLFNKFV